MTDSQGGNGTATATLAQTGSALGGSLVDTEGTTTLNAQLALTIGASNALSGSMVINEASGATCTFKTTGNYNTATNVLSGSYTAVTNCSGESGTFSLTQTCTDTVTHVRRSITGGIVPC
jgi:hypothetical protein